MYNHAASSLFLTVKDHYTLGLMTIPEYRDNLYELMFNEHCTHLIPEIRDELFALKLKETRHVNDREYASTASHSNPD